LKQKLLQNIGLFIHFQNAEYSQFLLKQNVIKLKNKTLSNLPVVAETACVTGFSLLELA